MDQVPIKALDEMQDQYKGILEHILYFVRDQAIIAKRLSRDKKDVEIKVIMPEISKKNVSRLLSHLPAAVVAIIQAQDSGLISEDTGTKIFSYISDHLGYAINPEEEIAKDKENKNDENIVDYNKVRSPFKKRALVK